MKAFWHPLMLCALMAGGAFGLERLDPFPEDRYQGTAVAGDAAEHADYPRQQQWLQARRCCHW